MKEYVSTIEQETCTQKSEYFLTPNTTIEKQRSISRYDNFDHNHEAYRKSITGTIINKYVILRRS